MNMSTLRNAFGRTRLLAVLCTLLFVFAAACGDDDTNNGTSNNGGTNNGGVDAGDTGGGGEDAGDEDTGGGGEDAGDEDTGGEDTGGGDECAPLDPAPADQADCSVLCQTGCATGEACIRGQDQQSGQTVLACQPAGTAGQGETCSGTVACAAGFGCLVENAGDTEGTCHEFCRLNSTEEPQCGDNARCLGLQGAEGLGACFVQDDQCQVFPNDDCADATQTCSPSPTGNECVTFDDTASAGEACTGGTDCNDQQACANLTGSPQCYDLCDPANPQCPEGTQCGGITFAEGEPPAFSACVAQ